MTVTDKSIYCISNIEIIKIQHTFQITKMKVDPVVSNSDELYITNQSQQNKIVYL